MRTQEWEFTEGHPVYRRDPEEDTRWHGALPGMKPRAYTPHTPPDRDIPEPQAEPLLMEQVGFPSVDVHLSPQQNTVQTIRLQTQYMQHMDLDRIRDLDRQWYQALRRMSLGPYSLKRLEAMGHPYGYDHPRSRSGHVTPTWGSTKKPRSIPGFKGEKRTGPRGFTPNRSVINIQSGKLYRSWRYSVLPHDQGVTLNFWNEAKSERGAPYPFFLAHGTIFMQAHGPWSYVAEQMMPELHREWRTGAAEAARTAALDEATHGAEAVASQERIHDAGGFR